MNLLMDEKIPAAWLNKDGPSSDFSSTFPYIICEKKTFHKWNCSEISYVTRICTQIFSVQVSIFQPNKHRNLIQYWAINLKILSVRSTNKFFGEYVPAWSIFIIIENFPLTRN